MLQQRSGPVDGTDAGGGVKISGPSDRFEREAAATAAHTMSLTPAPVPTVLQRQDAPTPDTPSFACPPLVQRANGRGAQIPEPPETRFSYDPHGDKHFTGFVRPGAQWGIPKEEAQELMLQDVRGNLEVLRRESAGIGTTCFYLTKKAKKPIGLLGPRGLTNTYSIQIEVVLFGNTITYHGYPDSEQVPLGLGKSKKKKNLRYV